MPDILTYLPYILAAFSAMFYMRAYRAPHPDKAAPDIQRAMLFALYAILAAVM